MQRRNRDSFSTALRPFSLVASALFACSGAYASDGAAMQVAQVEFNDLFLQRPGAPRVDVRRYSKGNIASPGVYRADIYVNQHWLGRSEVTLKQIGNRSDNVQPCFDRALLERMGVDLSKLSEQAAARIDGPADASACLTLPELVPDATAQFDNGELRLDISVPQASMLRNPRQYVDPRYWDEGVPAAILKYNANAYRSVAAGTASTQGYVGLTAGLNVGPWRFRHDGNVSYNSFSGGTQYQSVQTNMKRSIAKLKSQLVVGEAFTNGKLFDSVGFRGVQIESDERMYPASQRGYAPTIHGIANSNALVRIRQNGNVIYEANVAAGPFVIDDLYPTGYGGDLQVEVTEADGSKHVSSVPYAAPVNALRVGNTRFSATVGQYRSQMLSSKPWMFEGTLLHGFTNAITGYGGLQASEGYISALAGVALNTSFGAFGFDITQANASLKGLPSRSGQSMRITYSKLLAPTDTNLTMAAYRYSSSGYLSMRDAVTLRDLAGRGMNDHMMTTGVQRGRLQLTVTQNLPQGYGSFYLTGSTQDYWNQSGRDTQFQAGYSNNFKQLNYNVSLVRQLDATRDRWDNRMMLTLNVPLGSGPRAPYSSTMLQRDSDGSVQVQESVSGSLGVDDAFSYGLNGSNTSGGPGRATSSVGGNVSYASPLATLTGSASKGTGYSQVGAGLSGGVVAYSGGVAFAPQLAETVAIVEAKGAHGARVMNGSGLRVDRWGHAVVTSLQPFSRNDIELDPKGLPLSVELKSTSQFTVPTAGAVTRLEFKAEGGGRSMIIHGKTADGEPLPFGAQVFDAKGQEVGTVAQAGRVIVRSMKGEAGDFSVKWGDGTNDQCRMSVSLSGGASGGKAWSTANAVCVR